MVPSYFSNADSNASLAGISKWFVGSSKSKTLSCSNISFARAKRTRSPPDKSFTSLNTSSCVNKKLANVLRICVCVASGSISHNSSRTFLLDFIWALS